MRLQEPEIWLRDARLSPSGLYRYQLSRAWRDDGTGVCFIGLNPSTADGTVDDPTIRRMVGFARRWGSSGIEVVNLFGYRATDPAQIPIDTDFAIGPENDCYIGSVARASELVVACWGAHPSAIQRAERVLDQLVGLPIYHLGLTRTGQPKHPLYLRADTEPVLWERR